ncbi:MAG: hypothetical protein K2V38_14365, partial [Gemmataceae bacterium]|nr:hypothetical protein [Gemmataceae bacterium]
MIRTLPVGLLLAVLVAVAPRDFTHAQPPKAAPAGKKVALLVGVNVYQNRKLDDLKYAEADLTDLAAVL